ncbi:hypothetical protein, partial [Campylobacter sp.]|uniref:hypothetical protein n=1 Tax=Campylobacter sp. TaxID=205 RepID=UPI0025C6A800
SNREFILLLVASFIFGFFIIYASFFEKLQDTHQNLTQNLEHMKTMYYDNNQFLQNIDDIKYDLSLKEKIDMFKQDYQSKIQHIEKNLNKMKAKKVKFSTFHQKDEFFTFYKIKLEFLSDFNSLMEFISNLGEDIRIQNIELKKEGEELKISLSLIFALA